MIKIVKLQNNSEIIGHVIHEDDRGVLIEDPFTINYIFSPRSERPVIGLLRYMPFAESRTISFQKDNVIASLAARKSMANYYEAVLQSYIKEVDESIDLELESIAELEDSQNDTNTDVLTAMMERLNPNNSMH